MASAAAKVSFTCPHCDKTLKMSTRPQVGKKIKCPSCGEPFLPAIDDDEEAEATAVQEKPSLKAKGKGSKADPDEKPRKKSRDDDDDDLDDEDEEEERPSKKKKAKEKSGGSMILVLLLVFLGGGFLLSLGLVAVGLFVWPGWLRTKTPDVAKAPDPEPKLENKPPIVENKPPVAKGPNTLASYIFPDTTILLGSNVKALRDKNQLELMFNQIDMLAKGKGAMPNDFKELLRGTDMVMACVAIPAQQFGGGRPGIPVMGAGGKVMFLIQASPEAVAKIKSNPKMGQEEKLGGKYGVYRPGRNDRDWPPLVAIPSDRVIIACELPDAELITVLDRATRNDAPPAVTKLSAPVENSLFWAAMAFDQNIRRGLMGLNDLVKDQPQFAGAVQALQQANGATLSYDSPGGKSYIVQLNLDCANADAAKSAREGGDALKTLAGFALGGIPDLPPAIRNDVNAIQVKNQGNIASMTLTISEASVKAAEQLAMKGMMGGGPVEPFPKKDGFGPKDFGVKDFGPKDFAPKDLPKFDGNKDQPKFDGNKDFPKGGTPKSIISLKGLLAGQSQERQVTLNQGKRVTISMTCPGALAKTDVNLFILQGASGEKVRTWQDTSPGPNGSVTFIAPVSGVYRIRVVNLGPGTAANCIINVREE